MIMNSMNKSWREMKTRFIGSFIAELMTAADDNFVKTLELLPAKDVSQREYRDYMEGLNSWSKRLLFILSHFDFPLTNIWRYSFILTTLACSCCWGKMWKVIVRATVEDIFTLATLICEKLKNAKTDGTEATSTFETGTLEICWVHVWCQMLVPGRGCW